jgi:hypothetical protein
MARSRNRNQRRGKAVLHLLNSDGELMANKDMVEIEKAYESLLKFKCHAENFMLEQYPDMDKSRAFEEFCGREAE